MDSRQKLRQMVLSLYPHALSTTYCVPPVHFNHVPYVKETVAGQHVLVLQRVPDCADFSKSGPSREAARDAHAASAELAAGPSCVARRTLSCEGRGDICDAASSADLATYSLGFTDNRLVQSGCGNFDDPSSPVCSTQIDDESRCGRGDSGDTSPSVLVTHSTVDSTQSCGMMDNRLVQSGCGNCNDPSSPVRARHRSSQFDDGSRCGRGDSGDTSPSALASHSAVVFENRTQSCGGTDGGESAVVSDSSSSLGNVSWSDQRDCGVNTVSRVLASHPTSCLGRGWCAGHKDSGHTSPVATTGHLSSSVDNVSCYRGHSDSPPAALSVQKSPSLGRTVTARCFDGGTGETLATQSSVTPLKPSENSITTAYSSCQDSVQSRCAIDVPASTASLSSPCQTQSECPRNVAVHMARLSLDDNASVDRISKDIASLHCTVPVNTDTAGFSSALTLTKTGFTAATRMTPVPSSATDSETSCCSSTHTTPAGHAAAASIPSSTNCRQMDSAASLALLNQTATTDTRTASFPTTAQRPADPRMKRRHDAGSKAGSKEATASASDNISVSESRNTKAIIPQNDSHTKAITHKHSSTSKCRNNSPRSAAKKNSANVAAHKPTPYSLWTPPSQKELSAKPATVQSNNIQDDFAQNHVLHNLVGLGHHLGEVMFILSQFSFDDYLKRSAKRGKGEHEPLARPADLDQEFRRGDFDILIIRSSQEILIGEVKSVGWNQDIQPSPAQADADIAKRVGRGVEQLNKSEVVIRHLLNDLAPGLVIKKTLFLPYVSSDDLRRILKADPKLKQGVCLCLGARDLEKASLLCCCSDLLSDPSSFWHVTPAVLSRLQAWWRDLWTSASAGHTVTLTLHDDVYLEIVGRFVGTASAVNVHCVVPPRVEVRTLGEAVSEVGRRLARLVLTPQQLDLLDRAPPRVCVTGPPGVGKTVVLVLMGLKWLLAGHDVHVLSTRPASLAASQVMYYQLDMTLRSYGGAAAVGAETEAAVGCVRMHSFDFYREGAVEVAVKDLTAASRAGRLHVLMEEAVFKDSGGKLGPRYMKLINTLLSTLPHLHLWVARVRHDNIPRTLQTETLTTPLRSAPAVLREVRPGVERHNVHNYSSQPGVSSVSEGPELLRLRHEREGRGGHACGVWPHQCPQCGRDVAEVLLKKLNVGSSAKSKATKNSPSPLRFSDVFVLTRCSDLREDVTDGAGHVTSEASGVVRGLREAGVPVCVLEEGPAPCPEPWTDPHPEPWTGPDPETARDGRRWERDVRDTAVAREERVTVAHWRPVLGLERKVVVWLWGRSLKDDTGRGDEDVEAWDRLWVVSRCTTQLIVVDVSRGGGGGGGGDSGV